MNKLNCGGLRKRVPAWMLIGLLFLAFGPYASAQPGTLLQTVDLPGNGSCSVSGTLVVTDLGALYMTVNANGACGGTVIGVYSPPAAVGVPNVADPATLVASKNIVDGGGQPVTISGLAWDAARSTPGNVVLWGAHADSVYRVDVGDPASAADAVATFMFQAGVGGLTLVDGLARDPADDTLYMSPDVNQSVFQLSLGTDINPANPPLGTLMNTVSPQDSGGVADGSVSGVAIGSGSTLYIGRNGNAEIRRVDKTTGAFVSQFATTAGRVEALTCDPITYAPLEAVLAKDAYNALYEAFEVEPGTCPLPVEPTTDVTIDIEPQTCLNPLWVKEHGWGFKHKIRVAILGSEDLDVSTIDPNTIQLAGVSPRTHWKSDDVLAWMKDIWTSEEADDDHGGWYKHGWHKHWWIGKGRVPKKCDPVRPDGYVDLVLLFDSKELIAGIEAELGRDVENGEVITLTLTGQFLPEFGGGDFTGEDFVKIKIFEIPGHHKHKKKHH